MKKRYNISIEFSVMEEAKTNINNISRYLEKCLERANAYYRKKKPQEKKTPEDIQADREDLEEFIKNLVD